MAVPRRNQVIRTFAIAGPADGSFGGGIVTPAETRRVLTHSLKTALNRPTPPGGFGVFRM